MKLHINRLEEIVPLWQAIVKYDVLLLVGFECSFNGPLRFMGIVVDSRIDSESFACLCGSRPLPCHLH